MNITQRRAVYWGIGLVLAAIVLVVLAGLLVAPAYPSTSSGSWGWMTEMMGGYFPGGWSGGLMMTVGMLAMVLFWFGIILLAAWAIRAIAMPSAPSSGSATPLEIAKTRYARGEITKAEFEDLKRDLV